jgi:hypothetical protein
MITRIRDWIDRYEHGPLVASLVIILTPVLVAMQIVYTQEGAPWWLVPVALLGFLVLSGWICLVVAAVTRWFGR